MILEVATLDITPGKNAEFEAAFQLGAAAIKAAKGCRTVSLRRCLEKDSRYLLQVEWDTPEDHTVHFRNSEPFQKVWRANVGPFFAGTPSVEHYRWVG
jgi:heme-degrading monooxygenase HmoA